MKCKDNSMAKKATYEELEARIRELEQEAQNLKNSMKLLSEKEQAIQALVNAPTASALLIEPEQGVILACNEVAAQSLHSTVEDLMGLSVYDALSPDLANSRRKQAERVARSGKPVRFQDRRDGRMYDINLYPVLDSGRKVTHVAVFAQDVTERIKNQEALKLSEARLRTVIDCLPFDFFIVDKNGRYEMINAVCKKRWGNVVGKRLEDLSVDNTNLALWKENNRRAFSGETVKGEVELRTKGEKGYYYNIILPIKGKDEVLGILGVNIDITRIKKAESALKESEKKYRRLVELSPDAIVILQDQHYQFVNPAFSKTFGYTKEDVDKGLSFFELVQEGDKEAVRQQYERRLRGEEVPKSYNLQLVARDGSVIPCETSATLIDYRGRPADLVIIRDITERKQAEKALRESEQKYRVLVEQSQEGIVIFQGSPPRIVFVNSAIGEIYGYGKDEIMSMQVEDIEKLIYRDDREMIMLRLADRLKGKEVPSRYEVRGIRRDGSVLWLDVSATRITYQGTHAAQATFMDITDRKLAEQELQEAHDELEIRVKERTAELREAFKELDVKSKSLIETNTALKVLLEKRDGDKTEFEEKLIINVNQLVEPYLEKLKNTNLDERQRALLNIVESNVKDIASPFLKSLDRQHLKLTPTEIHVAELVKQGKSAKEIADLMNLSWKTIKTHRRNIRAKLNLKNKKTNLRSYLMSYQQ